MINGKYRLHYCDLYPEARRNSKKVWPRVVVAALSTGYFVFFSALVIAN